ncbi:hypothetical protein DEEACLCL_00171 [Salmonella phage CRW-SP2]|nr:hypothetical protein DEEACLCL_00171 [Salmonella phage CRW-SP2]
MKKVLVKLNTSPYTNVDIWFTNSQILYEKKILEIRQIKKDLGLENMAGIVDSNKPYRNQMVIGLFDNNSFTLVHEVSHATINLFHAVSMKVNVQTTEAFAYMLESLYQQCTNHLNEWSL